MSQSPAIFSLFPFWPRNCHFVCSSPQLTYLLWTCPLVFASLYNFSIHSTPQHNYTFCVESPPLLPFTLVCCLLILKYETVHNQPEETHKQKKCFLEWKRIPSFFQSCLWIILCSLRLFSSPTLFDEFWNWNDYVFPVLKCYLQLVHYE